MRKIRAGGIALFTVCTLILAGCQTTGDGSLSSTADVNSPIESRTIAARGVKALRNEEFDLASKLFNAALKLDIRSSHLQFLNALGYHLRAVRSDRTLFSLAEAGYKLAIKFDETNWMARYYLGLLHLDQRRYSQAKAAFADAMLYNEDDPDLLYNFTVASYYARDPETAAGPLTRLRELEPDSGRTIRASSVIAAALGQTGEAEAWLDRYKKIEPDRNKSNQLSRRLTDWGRVHARVQKVSLRVPSSTLKIAKGAQLVQSQDSMNQDGMNQENTEEPAQEENQEQSSGASAEAVAALAEQDKMVIVDVVIISSVEDISTAKGVNLLNGLNIQFGSPDGATPGLKIDRLLTRDQGTTAANT